MISHQQIKEALYKLNSEKNDALISHQCTGFMAGLCFALKDRNLAQLVDKTLRTEWTLGVGAPGGLYGPSLMADSLAEELKDTSNGVH